MTPRYLVTRRINAECPLDRAVAGATVTLEAPSAVPAAVLIPVAAVVACSVPGAGDPAC